MMPPPACYTLRSTPSPYNILLKNEITIASVMHFFVPPERRFPSCLQQSLDLHSPNSKFKLQIPNSKFQTPNSKLQIPNSKHPLYTSTTSLPLIMRARRRPPHTNRAIHSGNSPHSVVPFIDPFIRSFISSYHISAITFFHSYNFNYNQLSLPYPIPWHPILGHFTNILLNNPNTEHKILLADL